MSYNDWPLLFPARNSEHEDLQSSSKHSRTHLEKWVGFDEKRSNINENAALRNCDVDIIVEVDRAGFEMTFA
jgi:hypothetical protein